MTPDAIQTTLVNVGSLIHTRRREWESPDLNSSTQVQEDGSLLVTKAPGLKRVLKRRSLIRPDRYMSGSLQKCFAETPLQFSQNKFQAS